MSEHMTEWLNAFLDGELRGPRLGQVQDHLAGCAICRAELDELRGLSRMLHEAPPVVADQPADRFIAELTLLLPRREESAPKTGIVWWLAPAGAVVVWVLLQAGLTIGGLISTAGGAGLLDGTSGWFASAPQHTAWFSAAVGLFGNQLGGTGLSLLEILDSLSVLRSDLGAQLGWQAGFALLYWAGLAFWWTHRTGLAGSSSALSFKQPGQDYPRA
jgi:anti-sigma factor RsiW